MGLFDFLKPKKNNSKPCHQKGIDLFHLGQSKEAIEMFNKSIELDPKDLDNYFNIAIIHKSQGKWAESIEYYNKMLEFDPENLDALKEIAFAATALKDWEMARSFWEKSGMEIEGDSGPINMDLGKVLLKLDSDQGPHILLGKKICPARAVIDSIPFPHTGLDLKDVVLYQKLTEPIELDGKEHEVVEIIELFEKSNYQTFIANVTTSKEKDLEKLQDLFSETKHFFMNWTPSTSVFCKKCSEGIEHDVHDDNLKPNDDSFEDDQDFVNQNEKTLGIAIYGDQNLEDIFDQWQKLTGSKLLVLENGKEIKPTKQKNFEAISDKTF